MRDRIPLPTFRRLLTFCMGFRHLVLIVPSLFVLSAAGCSSTSSDSPGGSGGDCKKVTCNALDYASLDATPVSFKNDIFTPILRPTCNTSSCHGLALAQKTADLPGAGLYLGPLDKDTVTTVDDNMMALINTELTGASRTAPSMKLAAAGDPANSFLMLKLTGCQNTKSLSCTVQSVTLSETKSGCGDTMPASCYTQMNGLTPPTQAQLTIIARWIAQGAKNN